MTTRLPRESVSTQISNQFNEHPWTFSRAWLSRCWSDPRGEFENPRAPLLIDLVVTMYLRPTTAGFTQTPTFIYDQEATFFSGGSHAPPPTSGAPTMT